MARFHVVLSHDCRLPIVCAPPHVGVSVGRIQIGQEGIVFILDVEYTRRGAAEIRCRGGTVYRLRLTWLGALPLNIGEKLL